MRFIVWLVIFFITISSAKADYLADVKNLGSVSGLGIACGAQRYKSYEVLARAYLISAAKSDEEMEKGMYEYNSAKAGAYLFKQKDGLWDCNEINERFNQQKIFQAKLYKNGTLKMSDGKIIKPRRKYDVTKIYDKTQDERQHLQAYYDRLIEKKKIQAKKEGIYDKIRKAELKASY